MSVGFSSDSHACTCVFVWVNVFESVFPCAYLFFSSGIFCKCVCLYGFIFLLLKCESFLLLSVFFF